LLQKQLARLKTDKFSVHEDYNTMIDRLHTVGEDVLKNLILILNKSVKNNVIQWQIRITYKERFDYIAGYSSKDFREDTRFRHLIDTCNATFSVVQYKD
jgi:hypothetical protein